MANVKISQLPSLSTMTNEAIVPVVAGGVTQQISGANLANFFGGGAANTGNVTFSDQVIQGTGTQDGGGGLYLAPGTDSTGNLQYLRVRGGDYVTHIHLDTGNNAYYDQYFGADTKYVKLEANGNVAINADDGANSATYTFGADGNLTAAGNVISPSNFVGTSLRPNLTDFNWSESITGIATGATTVVTLANNVFGDPWSGQVVITDVSGATEANATWWYQAVDSNQFALYTDNTLSTPVNSTAWGAYVSGGFAVTLDYANVEINAQNITIRSDHGDYNNKIWTFNRAGQTVFPYQDVARGDNPTGNITGYAMVMGDGTGEAIISTPDGNINGTWSSQRLVINPGKGGDGTSGEGGDIYLWAGRGGDQDGSGGDIKIRGGQGGSGVGAGGYIRIEGGDGNGSGGPAGFIEITGGVGGVGQNGGYVRIQGGQGQNSGGDANITGGVGQGGPGGPVNIVGGVSANGLAEYGNVNITSGASTWTFDNTGTLNLPGGTGTVESSANNISIYSDAGQLNGALFYDTGSEIYALQDFAIFTDNANASHIWRFYANGSMTAPGAINVGDMSIGTVPGDITADANTGVTFNVSGPDGGFAVNYLKEVGNANTSGGELAFSSETGNATYRISLSDDLGDGFATKIWRFDGAGNFNLPSQGNIVGVTAYNSGRIQWVGNSSGDGAGYTTLQLVPDDTLTGNDQYLIIDPTAPGHIHIRAGGTQDNSSADLFLGGENSYFKVNAGANNEVRISANSHAWVFGADSVLTLPGEGILRSIGDVVTLQSYNVGTGNVNSVYLGSGGGLGFFDQDIGGNWLEIFRSGAEPQIRVPVGLGNLNIQTAQGNTAYDWVFDNSGNLTLPGNITGNTGGYTIGYRDIPQVTFSANATAALTDAGKHYYSTTAGNLALTLPDNSSVAFPTGATLTIVVNAAGNVLVNQGTGVTLYQAGASATGNRVVGAYGLASVMKVAANTWVISGTGVY